MKFISWWHSQYNLLIKNCNHNEWRKDCLRPDFRRSLASGFPPQGVSAPGSFPEKWLVIDLKFLSCLQGNKKKLPPRQTWRDWVNSHQEESWLCYLLEIVDWNPLQRTRWTQERKWSEDKKVNKIYVYSCLIYSVDRTKAHWFSFYNLFCRKN